jgi:hypothetical protein
MFGKALRHQFEHDMHSAISSLMPAHTLMPMKVMRDESAPWLDGKCRSRLCTPLNLATCMRSFAHS